ncbi:hypothetical protein OV203_47465 [Nannocystis sp. ILAH1]|nr:hypothetical protein [Nannocystis sp. ILAH1]MCY0994858.1 hypothetical protein [Nannocystis sp. ILAH1]
MAFVTAEFLVVLAGGFSEDDVVFGVVRLPSRCSSTTTLAPSHL